VNLTPRMRLGRPVPQRRFWDIRNRMVLHHFKWDPQVGSSSVLFPQPVLIGRQEWQHLANLAEALARETTAMADELANRPELSEELGVPAALHPIRSHLRGVPTPALARTLRFDFHPTVEGWQVSEVNSDVPGGFSEASNFSRLMADATYLEPVGDPLAAWAWVVASGVPRRATVAFLSAPWHMEDHQVTLVQSAALRRLGVATIHVHDPYQISWRDAVAQCGGSPLDGIVRFYQAEWLARHRPVRGWAPLFCRGRTPVTNPYTQVFAESKRLPLIWDRLTARACCWRQVAPETKGPSEFDCRDSPDWVVKQAYSNTGEGVFSLETLGKRRWISLASRISRSSRSWVLQRRFRTVALESEIGLLYPCVGVFTVNEQVCGAYVRLSRQQFTDYSAYEAALLLERDSENCSS
jgi:glutathionylspermidine synthase